MGLSKVFRIQGMTCQGCVAEIESALEQVESISSFRVSLDPPELQVELDSAASESLDEAHAWLPARFQLLESEQGTNGELGTRSTAQTFQIGSVGAEDQIPTGQENTKTTVDSLPQKNLATYWPLILVVGYILIGMFIAMEISSNWRWDFGMRMFMGLFFVAFSFFKLLDLKGFARAYQGYDWVARRVPAYGLVYPFLELMLGCAYLLGLAPLAVNWITLIVMSVSIGGVIESVVQKRTIRCACLGTGFNLPMSQVTIIEDGVMIAMAAIMIVKLSL